MLSTIAGIPRVHRMAKTYATKYNVMILEWDRESVLSKQELSAGIEIHRFKFKAPYGINLILKLPIWIIYIIIFCVTNKFNVIVPENLDTLLPIWTIAKLKREKIIYDIADFYADAYIPNNFRTLRRIVADIERFLIKRVNAVIIPNPSYILEQLGDVDKRKVFVIYNTNYDSYEHLSQNAVYDKRISKFVNDKFTIFYGGGIGPDRGLYHLVGAVDGMSDIRLLVAGFGAMEKEFKNHIRDKENILYIGKVEHAKILELTYLSNCIAILYAPIIRNFIYASPNKLFEAMMCGKPIIAIKGTYLSKIVTEENCGLVIESKNVEMIRTAITKLRDNPTLANELGNNGRKAFVSRYNWFLMENTLLTIIRSITL